MIKIYNLDGFDYNIIIDINRSDINNKLVKLDV